jgi:choline dehydrogenase
MSTKTVDQKAGTQHIPPKYTHIIVGGGSAGAVLANRLSEDPSLNILLLEAGETFEEDTYPEVLANSQILGANGDSRYDWGYRSVPDDTGYSIQIARAKVLGGCSAVNGAVAVRGIPNDFKRWTELGLSGWSFEQVLPYYKRLETSDLEDDRWHGRDGYLPVNQLTRDDLSPMQIAFMDAAKAKGFDEITDFNGETQYGVGAYPANIVAGVRMNTGMTYLKASVRQRSNLTIFGNVLADRLLFEGNTAIGVLSADGRAFFAGQIILSAGTYGSAGILQRSGIGPSDVLEPLGIPVIADLPVGKNILDHPFYFNTYTADPEKIGRLSPVTGVNVWTRSSFAGQEELDIHITAGHLFDPAQSPTGAGYVIGVALTNPSSRGTIRISSKNAVIPPVIDLNFLGTEEDRQRFLEGVKLSRELARTAPLNELTIEELAPGPERTEDELILTSIRQTLNSYNHVVASAPMGVEGSEAAVVDSTGAVYGIQRLRVVDASILPDFVSTGPNVTVIMVAEKLADVIKANKQNYYPDKLNILPDE